MGDDIERRLIKLENNQEDLRSSIAQLNTTLALLNQAVSTMALNEEKKKQMLDKGILFVIGGFVAAFLAWVFRGGLSS